MWEFFDCEFEYEELFNDFGWAWAGHKKFAYDLVRNLKPKLIVELGTHKGTSFFSFCQAVKDGGYDTQLCAVDTWKGDQHAGFYDESVFEEFKVIRDRYYGKLNISLLRKTFDEAVTEFEDRSIDILHIDGLHLYEAVKHDFETWLPKVKKDGIILFHDIFISRDNFGVYRLWNELKNQYSNIEFYHSYGLGVLFLDDKRFQELIAREREFQMRYSCLAEDRKNGEISRLLYNYNSETFRLNQALAERDQQITSLNQAVAERDQQIASLNQAVAELDQKITSLNQAIVERDEKVSALDMALAERDQQITSLNQAVAERDQQIASLNQAVAELDQKITSLNQAIVERDEKVSALDMALAERDPFKGVARSLGEPWPTSWRLSLTTAPTTTAFKSSGGPAL